MKQYSESTLMGMTKKELVQEVLIAYHNQNAAEATVRQQAVNMMDWEPVRHGRWIKDGSNRHECSECHKTKWVWGDIKMEYCEHCGAKMDGGDET